MMTFQVHCFITHLEDVIYEKRTTKGNEMEALEDSETVKSILQRSDPYERLKVLSDTCSKLVDSK